MTATFYTGSPGNLANGKSWAWNVRHYHGLFAASNRVTLGRRETLVSRSGRCVTVTIADHVGHGTDYDLAPEAFRKLAGPKYRVIGRLSVQVRKAGR